MLGRKNRNPNQEIEEYRDLMQVPDQFEDGFTIKAVLGVLFVAFIMVPGNMYLSPVSYTHLTLPTKRIV